MLKFVHTKPPRARSSSPASSLDHSAPAAYRHRDRSFPQYPPPLPAYRDRHQDRPHPPHVPSQPPRHDSRYSPSPPVQPSQRARLYPVYPPPPQSRYPGGEVGIQQPPHSRADRSERDSLSFDLRAPSQPVKGPSRGEGDYDQLTVVRPQAPSDRGRHFPPGSVEEHGYGVSYPSEGRCRFDRDYSRVEFVRAPPVHERERAGERAPFFFQAGQESVERFPVAEEERGGWTAAPTSPRRSVFSDTHTPPTSDVSSAGPYPVKEQVQIVRHPDQAGTQHVLLSDRQGDLPSSRYSTAERQRTGLQGMPVKVSGISRQPEVPVGGLTFFQTHQPSETRRGPSHPSSLYVTERPVETQYARPGKFPVTDSDRESSKPVTKERHVRIAPYPAEIFIGTRDAPSSVTDRDRSESPSAKPLQSILSKHPKERTHSPVKSASTKDRSDEAHLTSSGLGDVKQVRGSTPGSSQARPSEVPITGTGSKWRVSPQQEKRGGKKAARGKDTKGKEADKKGKKVGKGKEGEGSGVKGWTPKLFFSGSWLHGPSRHRIFATKSAQPPPPVCMAAVSSLWLCLVHGAFSVYGAAVVLFKVCPSLTWWH
ncbi:hypothetical protein ACOMHN_021042 [Nucella lapillus]